MAAETSNINDYFFDGIYKDVWRKITPPGLSEAECDFIQDIAVLTKEDKVLDLMCGYGRHALELASRGFSITAIDNLQDYITEINSVAAQKNLAVEAFAVGALDMQLQHLYKAVICMGNSFAFFNRHAAVELLKKISSHLQPDGILIINSWMIAEIAIKYFKEKEWAELDGYKYLMDYKYYFQPSRIESEHTIIDSNGGIQTLHGIDYIFTLAELETMFNEAGLITKAVYGTPRKRPFRLGDNRVYIVAGQLPG